MEPGVAREIYVQHHHLGITRATAAWTDGTDPSSGARDGNRAYSTRPDMALIHSSRLLYSPLADCLPARSTHYSRCNTTPDACSWSSRLG